MDNTPVNNAPVNNQFTNNAPVKPNNYLALAILSTILGCSPFGIVSIIYASSVDGLWLCGHYAEAAAAAKKAKIWFWVAFGSGLFIFVVYLALVIISVLLTEPSYYYNEFDF